MIVAPHYAAVPMTLSSVFAAGTGAHSVTPADQVTMVDEKQVRRKVILRTLGHPLVLAPFMAGMTAMIALLTLTQMVALGVFSGLAGVLGMAGAYVTRMIFRGDETAREITDELAGLEVHRHQRALDELDQALAAEDKDSRPEVALRDLRALVAAFDKLDEEASGAHIHSVVEIRMRVQELFTYCVKSLHQTRRLWQTAQQLQSPEARGPLLAQRENIISDVQATLRQVSNTLVGLQTLDSSELSSRQFQRVREELDQSLDAARSVESRVENMLNDPGYDVSEFSQPTNQQTKG